MDVLSGNKGTICFQFPPSNIQGAVVLPGMEWNLHSLVEVKCVLFVKYNTVKIGKDIQTRIAMKIWAIFRFDR